MRLLIRLLLLSQLLWFCSLAAPILQPELHSQVLNKEIPHTKTKAGGDTTIIGESKNDITSRDPIDNLINLARGFEYIVGLAQVTAARDTKIEAREDTGNAKRFTLDIGSRKSIDDLIAILDVLLARDMKTEAREDKANHQEPGNAIEARQNTEGTRLLDAVPEARRSDTKSVSLAQLVTAPNSPVDRTSAKFEGVGVSKRDGLVEARYISISDQLAQLFGGREDLLLAILAMVGR